MNTEDRFVKGLIEASKSYLRATGCIQHPCAPERRLVVDPLRDKIIMPPRFTAADQAWMSDIGIRVEVAPLLTSQPSFVLMYR